MAGISDLKVFLGEWTVEVRFPDGHPGAGNGPAPAARSVFEWILGGRYLTQRSEVDHPDAPNSFSVYAYDPYKDGFTQHYYDSRDVIRLYAMTLSNGVWTLTREASDFSPLDFRQRYVGTFSADGDRIDGAWEMARLGEGFKTDFQMNYVRKA
jgi:hypothetical protein